MVKSDVTRLRKHRVKGKVVPKPYSSELWSRLVVSLQSGFENELQTTKQWNEGIPLRELKCKHVRSSVHIGFVVVFQALLFSVLSTCS
jgi:hypothetical protein